MNPHAEPTPDPWDAACPSRELLALIGDKWVLLLLPKLAHGPKRNGDLLRALGGVSQKMLTQTLKAMERDGLVARHDFGVVPPRVEYTLTALGQSLAKPVAALDLWVVEHFRAVESARQKPHAASGASRHG